MTLTTNPDMAAGHDNAGNVMWQLTDCAGIVHQFVWESTDDVRQLAIGLAALARDADAIAVEARPSNGAG